MGLHSCQTLNFKELLLPVMATQMPTDEEVDWDVAPITPRKATMPIHPERLLCLWRVCLFFLPSFLPFIGINSFFSHSNRLSVTIVAIL
jgi:hypothetical protein